MLLLGFSLRLHALAMGEARAAAVLVEMPAFGQTAGVRAVNGGAHRVATGAEN